MSYFIQDLKNKFDFFLRQKLKFSRKNYFEKNESKEDIVSSPEEIEREQILFDKYNLDYLKSNSTRQNYLENLYTIDLLDKYLKPEFKNNLRVLDIGCKNWFYAKGEYFFFKQYCEKLDLTGIEVDSERLYSNFYTRGEVAKFHIKNLESANYIYGDFLEHNQKYDYMVWILPFVVKEPLMKWGLPLNYFKPENMLKHAYENLNKCGQIFIINQGEAEYNVQKELCNKIGMPYISIGKVKSDFMEYKIPRYAVLIKN